MVSNLQFSYTAYQGKDCQKAKREEPVGRQTIAILACLITVGCGSSGGFDPGTPGGGCNTTPVAGQIQNGEKVISRDGRTTLTAAGLLSPITVSIVLDCQPIDFQIGSAYIITFPPANGTVTMTISYADINLGSISVADLRVGEYDVGSDSWNSNGNERLDPVNKIFTLDNPESDTRYAIFVVGGGGGGGDTTPPSTPTVTSVAAGQSSMTIIWTAATDNVGGTGVTSYLIYRRPGLSLGSTDVISTQPSTTLTFTDTGIVGGLEHRTLYCYSVAAQDGNLNRSSASAEQCRQFP